jgi:DNA-binding CsgD family transcriptional regulator
MLVGRRPEQEALDRLLGGARDGRSGVLLIRGEAGIGKTALLEYVEGEAAGMSVLRAVGIQSESELAFAGLHQLFRPVFERIEALPERQGAALRAAFALSAESVDDRFHVALGVLALLGEVAEEQPLLCTVDDAQWLDAASTEALLFAARRLEAEPVALVLAAREDAARPFAAPGLDELVPAPLGEDDARTLALRRLRRDTSTETLDRLVETAHGNPLALIELSTTDSADGELPTTSVEETYLERIGRLSDPVRSMIVLAAAEESGDRATIADAAGVLGLDQEALAVAEAEGLVRVTAERVDFRHPLVRSAAYNGARFTERERAHRTLAAVLTADADADRRAWHRAAATVGADNEVAAELEQSANRARLRGGHGSAAAALARAAELSTVDDERGRRFLLAATAANLAGNAPRTIAYADRAEPFVSDPIQRADLAFVRGTAEMLEGRGLDASDVFAAAAQAVAPYDAGRAVELAAASVEAAAMSGDRDRLHRGHGISRDIEIDPGDERQAMLSMFLEAGERVFEGDAADAVPLLREALSLFSGSPDPRRNIWAGAIATFLGDQERARALTESAVAAARRAGALGILPYTLGNYALTSVMAGRVSEAASGADEAVRLARDLGNEGLAAQPLAVLAWIAALRGRESECRDFVDRSLELAEPRALALATAVAGWALAELELGAGRWNEALAHYLELREVRVGFGHPAIANLIVPGLAEAAFRAGRLELASGPVAAFADWVEHTGATYAPARLSRCRALLASTTDEALEQYEEALERHLRGGSPFEQARTQLLYGELLRRLRRRADARVQLRDALQTFDRMGAAAWAERAQGELRATGETARKRDPSALGQLTPQEQQIARLVGEGASNKDVAAQLFLSPRTVEYHLRKVFMKLGIASRAELIRLGAETELAAASA